MTFRVLGVDGCRRGWAGIVWDGVRVDGVFAASLGELVAAVRDGGALDCVGVDMPIGLADSRVRKADRLAQQALGRRASSIFVTPTRSALAARDQPEAIRINRDNGGPGVTAQAWAIAPKIRDLDLWVRGLVECGDDLRVVEVHPELSFAELAGAPVAEPKRSWAGAALRRQLLRGVRLDLDAADLGEVGRLAEADDVVDAAVVAWTGMRVASGAATSLPDPPEHHSDGLPAAIWR